MQKRVVVNKEGNLEYKNKSFPWAFAVIAILAIAAFATSLDYYTGYGTFKTKTESPYKFKSTTSQSKYSSPGLPAKIDGRRVLGRCGTGIFGNCFKGQLCNNYGGECMKDVGGCYCVEGIAYKTP